MLFDHFMTYLDGPAVAILRMRDQIPPSGALEIVYPSKMHLTGDCIDNFGGRGMCIRESSRDGRPLNLYLTGTTAANLGRRGRDNRGCSRDGLNLGLLLTGPAAAVSRGSIRYDRGGSRDGISFQAVSHWHRRSDPCRASQT